MEISGNEKEKSNKALVDLHKFYLDYNIKDLLIYIKSEVK